MKSFKHIALAGSILLALTACKEAPKPSAVASAAASAKAAVKQVAKDLLGYVELDSPVAVANEDGKVEVDMFFGYNCGYCARLESKLLAWAEKNKDKVNLKHVPIVQGDNKFMKLWGKMYYALEQMGRLDVHEKAFAERQKENRLSSEKEIGDFVKANGVDLAKFNKIFSSPAAEEALKKYAELQKLYKFDTSPLFGINGRYLTSLQFASKREGVKQEEEAVATEMFKVLDELVAKSQKENAEAANKKATEAKTAKEEASAKIPEKAVADTGNKSADNAVNTAGASSSGIGGTEVFFDFGKSDLKAEGKESLDGLIEDLKKSDVKKIVLTGHTDSIGSDSFNMNLGKRRAQTVRNYLVGKGVNAKKVLVQSQGKRQPAYTNETEEGRAKNCRVVVQAS